MATRRRVDRARKIYNAFRRRIRRYGNRSLSQWTLMVAAHGAVAMARQVLRPRGEFRQPYVRLKL